MKRCPKCERVLSPEGFAKCRGRADGLQWQCKSCNKAYRDAIGASDRREDRRSYFRSYDLGRNYGMTIEDYELLHKQQSGRCAICHSEGSGKGLHVDHNHETGQVRGLLCITCNMRLATLEDSVWVAGAMRYLTGGGERAG